MTRHALLACCLLVGGAAQAQFGASIGVESDYRFRGVSLSDGRPDLRLSVAWDHASGVFAGASVTGVEFTRGRRTVQWLGYVGVVKRMTPELGAEVGVTGSTFGGDTRYDYSEAFVGLSAERWSLRAYYAPDYFGFRQATAYLELDANVPLAPRWRLLGHAGALAAVSGPTDDGRSQVRTDARIGIGLNAWPSVDMQLAWVTATRGGPYVVDYGTRRNTWVLGATASF